MSAFVDYFVDTIPKAVNGNLKPAEMKEGKTNDGKKKYVGLVEAEPYGTLQFFCVETTSPDTIHGGFSVALGEVEDLAVCPYLLNQNCSGFGPARYGAFFSLGFFSKDEPPLLMVEKHFDLDRRDLKNVDEAIESVLGEVYIGWLGGLSNFDVPDLMKKVGKALKK